MGIVKITIAVTVVIIVFALAIVLISVSLKAMTSAPDESLQENPAAEEQASDEDLKGTILLAQRDKPATRNFIEYDAKTGTTIQVPHNSLQRHGKFIVKNIDSVSREK